MSARTVKLISPQFAIATHGFALCTALKFSLSQTHTHSLPGTKTVTADSSIYKDKLLKLKFSLCLLLSWVRRKIVVKFVKFKVDCIVWQLAALSLAHCRLPTETHECALLLKTETSRLDNFQLSCFCCCWTECQYPKDGLSTHRAQCLIARTLASADRFFLIIRQNTAHRSVFRGAGMPIQCQLLLILFHRDDC